jgi:hypothetical protein
MFPLRVRPTGWCWGRRFRHRVIGLLFPAITALAQFSNDSKSSASASALCNRSGTRAKPQSAVPVSMTECEGINNCANWTFLGGLGNGQWPSGNIANLTVDQVDTSRIVIGRTDSTGASAGTICVLRGAYSRAGAVSALLGRLNLTAMVGYQGLQMLHNAAAPLVVRPSYGENAIAVLLTLMADAGAVQLYRLASLAATKEDPTNE